MVAQQNLWRGALLAMPILLFAVAVSAQDAPSAPTPTPQATAPAPRSATAPIGHRQPTAADVPNNPNSTTFDQEQLRRERALDSRLQICRGC